MAFRKQFVLAFALLALSAIALGCAEDTTAPNTQDEAPVLAPTNVQATVLAGGNIQITWNPSSQPDISGYNLYRREVGNGNSNKLNGSRIHATDYVDNTTRVASEYEYRVTAVNTRGRESRFTSVVVETPDVGGDRKGGTPGTQE